MSIFSYLKASFERKKARRYFQDFGYRVDRFDLEREGVVEYANWLNPLVPPKKLTQQEVDFFRTVIKEGGLAIDIGATTGDLTVAMGIAAGAAGLVLGLDPNTQVYAILEANARLNKDKSKIVPLPFAATPEDGEFYFASSEASFSNGGLVDSEGDATHGKFKLKQKVRGVNLEKYLQQHYPEWLPKLSFIKVDTEGHDLSVLKTIESLIAAYKPAIAAEVFPTLTREERTAMYDFLSGFGYRVYDVQHFDTAKPLNKILLTRPEDMAAPGTASNVLAII